MSLTLGQLAGILWRRKFLFLAGWVVLTALAAVAIRQLPPQYTSSALLMVDPRQIHLTDLTAVQDAGSTVSDLNFVRSEMQILGSDDIARQVVRALHLDSDPAFSPQPGPGLLDRALAFLPAWALPAWTGLPRAAAEAAPPAAAMDRSVAAYQSRFSTYNDGRSFTIATAFTAGDPALAQRILATHIQLYLDGQREAKQAVIRKAEAWFDQELANLHARVVASEDRQQAFRLKNGLLRTNGETTSGRQLTDVTTQLAQAQADLVQKTARYRQISAAATNGQGLSGADTAVLSSVLVQQLRQQASAAAQHVSQLEARFGSNHPDVLAAKAELASVNERIGTELNRLVSSAQSDAAIARANVDRLQASLHDLQHAVGTTSDAELTAAQLARESDADQRLYSDLLSRSKQVAVQRETQEPDASLVSSASFPLNRTSPRYGLLTILAVSGAALLSGAFTIALDMVRQSRFDSLADIRAVAGIAGLAIVPRIKTLRRQGHTALPPHTLLAASFQTLANSLVVRSEANATKVVAFTSAIAGDGKTLVSALFARSVAAQGRRVLLIDGDLRHHGLSRVMPVSQHGTLADLLKGTRSLAECVARDAESGVDVIPAGRTVADPAQVLELSRIRRLLAEARAVYDMVVIDTPPIGAVDDALPFASLADATVLVVRQGVTPQDVVQGTIERLEFGGARIVGAVLNGVDLTKPGQTGLDAYRLSSAYVLQSR